MQIISALDCLHVKNRKRSIQKEPELQGGGRVGFKRNNNNNNNNKTLPGSYAKDEFY